jgi:tetratricopeptide (TPR) repeat protein
MNSFCPHSFHQLNVEGAWEAFQRVYQLKPSAYIFQAGISLFYLGDFNAAGECFARNAQIYEARFGLRASEERLWRDACELMMLTKEANRRNTRQPSINRILLQEDKDSADKLSPETRKIVSIARGLFNASVMGNHYEVILSRAKLLWIAHNSGVRSGLDSTSTSIRRSDPKLWRLNSWYYLGLHYDVLGMEEESKKCMKNALKLSLVNSNAKDDFIHTLPMLHLSRRDWFDDDPLDDDTFTAIETSHVKKEVEANIQNSVDKLLLSEIQDALGRKGLKTSGGNKSDLKKRLLTELMEDVNALIFEER